MSTTNKTIIMKYNTISTSSVAAEGKKSTLTIYADSDLAREKMASSEAEVASIRGELELVQRALKLQTRRCRQLVAEYTKRLQLKEQQYQAEKRLRDDQLAKVLRALLVFEARLRQEQKFITHQLEEKDYTIKRQQTDIQKILSNHYCKNCNQYYNPSSNLESLDSSSEYVVTDYHDYQSSNFESLDSSSETYASVSEKDGECRKLYLNSNPSISSEDNIKIDSDTMRGTFTKNKNKDSIGRRTKRIMHRKSIGNYFEVLKIRTDNHSPSSNEETTSNDYENLDSLPSENLKDKIGTVSERIERLFAENRSKFDSSSSPSHNSDSMETCSNVTTCNTTVIENKVVRDENKDLDSSKSFTSSSETLEEEPDNKANRKGMRISDTIPVFEGDGETNDNWYASASDQEDEEQRDIYRNNPVLECMNQILMQNINDPMTSPPKSPDVDKKFAKNNKRVKFSDEEDNKSLIEELAIDENEPENDYYETPIQKTPNFYETPQSIYSNDYEQILSQCSESFGKSSKDLKAESFQGKEINSPLKKSSTDFGTPEQKINHYYIDMDTKSEKDESENRIVRKSKILRTPPALPPKPANLMSKYKIQNLTYGYSKDKLSEKSFDSEPDYCSISEINLPTPMTKTAPFAKINIVTEVSASNKEQNQKASNLQLDKNVFAHSQANEIKDVPPPSPPQYKPVSLSEPIPNFSPKKNVEKPNIQIAKQTSTKLDNPTPKKQTSDIPKLPQVTEIIIPDENESNKPEECISHDNYVKNNTQILKQKTNHADRTRPIQMGSTVSSLIASFNNKQLLSEIKQKPSEKHKANKRMFSSFENLQNLETHSYPEKSERSSNGFENFDLSQNFEEFKLDDCEIGDYDGNYSEAGSNGSGSEMKTVEQPKKPEHKVLPGNLSFSSSTHVELVRATNDVVMPSLNVNSLHQLKKKLELEKNRACINNQIQQDVPQARPNEPTYEHFLECTGLSSKSILTPSRLLSNHKSMLKPKDVKLRSKVKSNNVFERQGNTIKYWSEPYL